jgi:hypothetical protein
VKPHDAAAHVDCEDDRAPANNVPYTKVLANPAIRRRPLLCSLVNALSIWKWGTRLTALSSALSHGELESTGRYVGIVLIPR